MEFFDVVNALDEVVGRQPRAEVHRLGLMHRAAHVLLTNARGEFFLQKRSLHKDSSPGLWDSSSSGHVDSGEDYDHAAIREVWEELNHSFLIPPVRLFKIPACAETGHEFVWVYHARAEGPFRPNPDEIESGGWFSREEITRWTAARPEEFAPSFLLIWQRLTAENHWVRLEASPTP